MTEQSFARLHGAFFVSEGIWVGGPWRWGYCGVVRQSRALWGPFVVGFKGRPLRPPRFQGKRRLCLGADTQGKLSWVKQLAVGWAAGGSDLLNPGRLFCRMGGLCATPPLRGESGGERGEGVSLEEKAMGVWGFGVSFAELQVSGYLRAGGSETDEK